MSSPITEEGGDVEGGEMKKVASTEIDPKMPDPVVIDMGETVSELSLDKTVDLIEWASLYVLTFYKNTGRSICS